ncbi:hypothetical protein [Burkholderia ubonensis]|uniref:hypothetical protein n=1 Tax=Burkholderia ubonensis TaxID=101571 RepID=UPI000756C349|nr:hypothetical protein [Burkholderia ubonensis]KVP17291.1 hypothetical protein WJ84_03410 [Burkholderia ubonensis]
MKTLLLMADDGVSGQVWLHMAKHYLNQGRTVLAITDDMNVYEAIGTGDGLPGYNQGLTGHPNFRTSTVGLSDADRLVTELQALDAATVVMFNMSPFEFLRHNPGWQAVLNVCAQCENEMVVAHYQPHYWQYDLDGIIEMAGQEVMALADIQWDYVAGTRVVSPQNIETLRRLIPSLADQIAPLGEYGAAGTEGTFPWQIITHAGSFELRLAYALTCENLEAYPALWDVRHDVARIAIMTKAAQTQETSFLRKFAVALTRIF